MPTTFDLDAYTRSAQGSLRDEIGAVTGLDDDELRLVRMLRDLEGGTMEYLRRVLVTPTHRDARVTAFLVTWAYEKHWIADALSVVLDANHADGSAHAPSAALLRVHGDLRARRGPTARALSSFFAGPPLVAAHLAANIASDAVTRAALAHLESRTRSRGARDLYRRIRQIDARHGAFFLDECTMRLAESANARRLARRELASEVYPFGMADRDPFERAWFVSQIFAVRAAFDRAVVPVATLPGVDARTIDAMWRRMLPRDGDAGSAGIG